MPQYYTKHDLTDAIERGNVQQLERILADADDQGIPYVDINDLSAGTAIHVLFFRSDNKNHYIGPHGVLPIEIAREMTDILTGLRDTQGNPVLDINIMHPNAGSAITAAIDLGDPYIVQTILDVHERDGELFCDLTASGAHGSFWSPLTRALFKDQLQMVQMLADVRYADGSFRFSNTDINDALAGLKIKENNAMRWLKEYMKTSRERKNAAPVRRPTPRPARVRRPTPRPARVRRPTPRPELDLEEKQAPGPAADRAINVINIFNNDTQNTHNPTVTLTIKGSINALKKRYTLSDDGQTKIFDEIEDFIRSFDYNSINVKSHFTEKNLSKKEKYDLTNEFWELTKIRRNVIHSYTKTKIIEIACLVWMGVNDRNDDSLTDDLLRPTLELSDDEKNKYLNNIIKTRKESMIEKFIEAAQTYPNNGEICIGGGIHKLIEILNHAHADVVMVTGEQGISRAATDMFCSLVDRKFSSITEEKKKNSILSTWGLGEEKSDGYCFRESIREQLKDDLRSHFGTLIKHDELDSIVDSIHDLSRPKKPNKELNELVDHIENICPNSCTQEKKNAIERLRLFSTHIYFKNDLSDDEKIHYLKAMKNCWEHIENDEDFSKYFLNFDLELMKLINTIKEPIDFTLLLKCGNGDLSGIKIEGSSAPLIKLIESGYTDFSGTNLTFSGIKLANIDLTNVNLASVTFTDVKLGDGVSLPNDLSKLVIDIKTVRNLAEPGYTDLSKANLTLSEIELTKTDLEDAKSISARLKNIRFGNDVTLPKDLYRVRLNIETFYNALLFDFEEDKAYRKKDFIDFLKKITGATIPIEDFCLYGEHYDRFNVTIDDLIKNSITACERYLKHLEKNHILFDAGMTSSKSEIINKGISFLKDQKPDTPNHIKLFNFKNHMELNKETLSNKRDNAFLIFLKSLGVLAASIFGVIIGGYFAHNALFGKNSSSKGERLLKNDLRTQFSKS